MSGVIDLKALNLSFQGKKKIPFICYSGKDQTMETIKRSMVARSLGEKGDEYTAYRSFLEQ